MFKLFSTVLAVVFLVACTSNKSSNSTESQKPTEIKKVEKALENQEIDHNGNKMWLGEINEQSFENGNYAWYQSNKDNYEVNHDVVAEFAKDLKDYKIEIFMGTWCGDSKRETPNFFEILDAANFPEDQITMYAVDTNKNTPSGIESEKDVRYVPTFIFYKGGKEVGRIVESPMNSLEEDIRDIVAGNPQTPNYAE